MSIELVFMKDGRGEIRRSHFKVEANYMVFDGEVAVALDHLLDHLKVLHDFSWMGASSAPLRECLSKHPQYRISKNDEDYSHEEDEAVDVLESECILLVHYLKELSTVSGRRLESKLASVAKELENTVPFLNYSEEENHAR